MLKSSFCDYSDAYILGKKTITFPNTAVAPTAENNTNKKVIFINCATVTDSISEINSTQVDNAKDIDIVMSVYNLIEYGDNQFKTSGRLCQYFRYEPAVNGNGAIVDLNEANPAKSFNSKGKITGQTGDNGRKMLK